MQSRPGILMPQPDAPARHDSLRRHNVGLVLRAVAQRGPLSRAQLAVETGLTKATVSQVADALLAVGLVTELAPERGGLGRPGSPLVVNAGGAFGVGVEIAVDYVSVCAVDLGGGVVGQVVQGDDNRGLAPLAVVERAAALTRALCHELGTEGRSPIGVVVAVPGLVQLGTTVRLAPNLPGWQDLPLAAELTLALALEMPVPVEAANEANLAAMAEFWYGGRSTRDFVHVSGEIGVGGGVVVDGALFGGVRGFAGELGHISVDPKGPLCGCGSRGCLEQYAGQEALLRAAGVLGGVATRVGDPDGPVHELVRRAQTADMRTLAALRFAGESLGVALSALVNVLDVPTIVLGGIYAQLAPWLEEPLARELRVRAVASRWDPVEVVVSTLAGQAAVRGAAGVSVDRVLSDPVAYFPALQG
jgi:predicted NBD/HSP70 family sugar kinase